MGVSEDGRRELLGLKVGDSDSEPFWAEFISCLKERGLGGVKLVISDAHAGLTKAIGRQLQGSVWQRCRVHFARNLLQCVPKAHQGMVTAALRSVFAQETAEEIDSAGTIWPPHWRSASPRPLRSCTRPRRTCWPSEPSPRTTGARSEAPTCWSGSTRKSSAAPGWSASSQTTLRSPAWWVRCCWSSTSTCSWRAGACFPLRAWQPSPN
jgi:putative transposase